jgi:Tfp pilus assembly protein PilV
MTADEAKRDEWKRLACALVLAKWPEAYEAMAAPCRARARTAKPDHQIEGVSDACEAACIAFHVLRTSGQLSAVSSQRTTCNPGHSTEI